MQKILLALLPILLLIACNQKPQNPPKQAETEVHLTTAMEELPPVFDPEAHIADYEALRKRMYARKSQLYSRTSGISQAEIKRQFFHHLVDSIFPYWYGTDWDFNGITETPRTGQIACGYFVSTTLRHMGIKFNRYRLAQKAAYDILKDLSKPRSIKRYTDFDKMIEFLESKEEDEIFLLGLDYHVGFVVRKDQGLFFIHSDYFSDEVQKELMSRSYSARSSEAFYLGNLTANEVLMMKWLKEKR
ncbi:MAG: hypothetical protein AAGD28_30995 [Bacteroidota bacterium]